MPHPMDVLADPTVIGPDGLAFHPLKYESFAKAAESLGADSNFSWSEANSPLPCFAFLPNEHNAAAALILAPDANTAGARLTALKPPAEIRAADDLPPHAVWVSRHAAALNFFLPLSYGFDYHWLREVAAGVLEGVTGVRLDAAATAELGGRIAGGFSYMLLRDGVKLRLRWMRRAEKTLNFAAQIEAQVKLNVPLPGRADDLLAALIGHHAVDYIRWVAGSTGSPSWSEIPREIGAESSDLAQFLDRWRHLPARIEGVLCKAARAPSGVQSVMDWAARVTSRISDPQGLSTAIADAFDSDPQFAESPTGQWLEASAQQALTTLMSRPEFERVTASARMVLGLFSGKTYRAMFEALVEQAEKAALPRVAAAAQQALALRDKLYGNARSALEKSISAELGFIAQSAEVSSVWADALFDDSTSGIASLRRSLAGDVTWLTSKDVPGVELRQALLSHQLRRVRHIELHLPFTTRRTWDLRQETLAYLDIQTTDDGRMYAFETEAKSVAAKRTQYQSTLTLASSFVARKDDLENSHFTLGFSDTRKVTAGPSMQPWLAMLSAYGLQEAARCWLGSRPPGEEIDATLSLALPGTFLSNWTHAPALRDPESFPVFARLSVSVQAVLRRWLPALYFSQLERYRTLGAAQPLVVYQATDPFPGKPRNTFTYDVLEPESMERAWRSAGRNLPEVLRGIYDRLKAAEMGGTASFYDPRQSRCVLAAQRRWYRLYQSLLVADTFLVNQLVGLATEGRNLRATTVRDPARAVKDLAKFSEHFVSVFHGKLRHLYGSGEWLGLGSLLLLEATRALSGGETLEPIAGTLELKSATAHTVLVNSAFRP
jgi:hypothetical protein